jgi:hypothetical protein
VANPVRLFQLEERLAKKKSYEKTIMEWTLFPLYRGRSSTIPITSSSDVLNVIAGGTWSIYHRLVLTLQKQSQMFGRSA